MSLADNMCTRCGWSINLCRCKAGFVPLTAPVAVRRRIRQEEEDKKQDAADEARRQKAAHRGWMGSGR